MSTRRMYQNDRSNIMSINSKMDKELGIPLYECHNSNEKQQLQFTNMDSPYN